MLSKKSSAILSAMVIALLTSTSTLAGDKSLEAGLPSNKTKGDSSWIKNTPEKTSAQSAADKAREARMEEMKKSMAKAKEAVTEKGAETPKPAAKVEEAKTPAEEPKKPTAVEPAAKPSHKTPVQAKKEDKSSPDFYRQQMKERIARNKLKKQEDLLKLQEANKAKKADEAAKSKPMLGAKKPMTATPPVDVKKAEPVKPSIVTEHEKVDLKLPEAAKKPLEVKQHPDLVMTQHPDKVEVKSKTASADEEAKVEAAEMNRNPAMKKAMERSSGSSVPKASPHAVTPKPEIVIEHEKVDLKLPEAAKKPLEVKQHPDLVMEQHPDKVEKVTNLKLPESALKVEQHPDLVVEQHPDKVEKVTNLKLPESALKVEQHEDKVEVSSASVPPTPPKKSEVGTENAKPKLSLMEEIRNRKGQPKPTLNDAPKTTPPAA